MQVDTVVNNYVHGGVERKVDRNHGDLGLSMVISKVAESERRGPVIIGLRRFYPPVHFSLELPMPFHSVEAGSTPLKTHPILLACHHEVELYISGMHVNIGFLTVSIGSESLTKTCPASLRRFKSNWH